MTDGRRPFAKRPISRGTSGVSLVEVLIGTAVCVTALVWLPGALIGVGALNEHARHLSWAMTDANRVIEQLRQQNGNGVCATPFATAIPPTGFTTSSWNAWLAAPVNPNGGGGGSNMGAPLKERIFVTCHNAAAAPPFGLSTTNHCGNDNGAGNDQISRGEWRFNPASTSFEMMQVIVSVCWRHRGRVIGECQWNAAANRLDPDEQNNGDNDGILESPAMISTTIACR